MEVIKLWLNGNKNYYTGVVLYIKHGSNEELKDLFRQGETDYNSKRLVKEMEELLDPQQPKEIAPVQIKKIKAIAPEEKKEAVNPELYDIAATQAKNSYKEVMNLRAELFAMARADELGDCNRPDKVKERAALAVAVVMNYNSTSKLYDSADHIRTHGRLESSEEFICDKYAALPDHLVKRELDNCRKNRNKLQKLEPNPKRTERLQEHIHNIKILEERWQLLQIK